MQQIYIEEQIKDHPRVLEIIKKFKNAHITYCSNYNEIFNPTSQNFRVQKRNPAIILAKKNNNFVHKTPEGYGIGSNENFYFSHMLNCPFDCKYCFLQGMFNSANYVIFVNYEDFQSEILKVANDKDKNYYFFSGYDCDSLAYDAVTNFVKDFANFFKGKDNLFLELRTKSTQIKELLKIDASQNIIVAYSFTPNEISKKIEIKVPDYYKRLQAIKKLQNHGYKIGLRFDPVIYASNYQELYIKMFEDIKNSIDVENLHSISIGPLRFPEKMFNKISKLHRGDSLFSFKLEKRGKIVSYGDEIESEIITFVENQIKNNFPKSKIFKCY